MRDAKELEFLKNIARRSGRAVPLTDPPQRGNVGVLGLVDADPQTPLGELKEQFIASWTALLGVAGTVAKQDVPKLVEGIVKEHEAGRVVGWNVPELDEYGVPDAVAAAGAAYRAWSDQEDIVEFAEQSTIGITTCDFAVAETGTLALFCDPDKGRLVSLLPPVYLALIPADRLVPRMTQVMRHVSEHGAPSSLNFVTGPSRTGDIESVLVVGVHGPGKVYAYIVE